MNEATEIRFEHRRLKPGVVPASLKRAHDRAPQLRARLMRRMNVWRMGITVVGAGLIAYATQKMGIELPYAMCLFFGALPVLWLGGLMIGFVFSARKVAVEELDTRVGSTQWKQELEAATTTEQVRLSLASGGLELERDGVKSFTPWARLRLERHDAKAVMIFFSGTELALDEALTVPRSAFGSDEAFDGFCLEAQRLVWAAQR